LKTYGCGKEAKRFSKILLVIFVVMLVAVAVSALFVSKVAGNDEEETLPSSLGKILSAQIQEIIQDHKEELLSIRLNRTVSLASTWDEKLTTLDEAQVEITRVIEEIETKMSELEEKLMNEEITQGEFIMEMNKLRLELRTRLRQLEEIENATQALQQDIPENNKELAKQIVEANHALRDAKKALHDEMKAKIKEKVEEQKQEDKQGKQDKEDKGKEDKQGKGREPR